ncbi:Winged helix DNA-binding domain-containing protein [Agreia bicolorata]|uniref:Winged helix DNA-binding domain-containing protein n=2 Tax=Agreia bicolorata TaxID=110935 RepID=A0A1T4YJA0_9MICO|nr:Winged helix DNA-binding domain-containing protein [Agreia bicolorata]
MGAIAADAAEPQAAGFVSSEASGATSAQNRRMRRTDRARIANLRLVAHNLVASTLTSPAEAASSMLATQAQDLSSAQWALAVRSPGSTITDVDKAFNEGSIVRSWPFRGTLHVTPAADLGWMLALTRDRILRGATTRHAGLGLDEQVFSRAADVVRGALRGGGRLSRAALLAELDASGIATGHQRGGHIIWYLAHAGLICFGPMEASGQAVVLTDEWIPEARRLSPDEALAELAVRYFTSHGPATLRDLLWWSKILVPEARRAIESAGDRLRQIVIDDTVYYLGADQPDKPVAPGLILLPGFDEYLLGYGDRDAVLPPEHSARVVPGSNGIFLPMVVSNGQVVGTWRRTIRRATVDAAATTFAPLTATSTARYMKAVESYARYLGLNPGEATIVDS